MVFVQRCPRESFVILEGLEEYGQGLSDDVVSLDFALLRVVDRERQHGSIGRREVVVGGLPRHRLRLRFVARQVEDAAVGVEDEAVFASLDVAARRRLGYPPFRWLFLMLIRARCWRAVLIVESLGPLGACQCTQGTAADRRVGRRGNAFDGPAGRASE